VIPTDALEPSLEKPASPDASIASARERIGD
jgi:hypothetical protein